MPAAANPRSSLLLPIVPPPFVRPLFVRPPDVPGLAGAFEAVFVGVFTAACADG
jgi:hypothetical protein